MGLLIRRTTSRLEATKTGQNAKISVVADVGRNVYFQLGKKSRQQGRVLCIAKTSQNPTVFVFLETQAIDFTKKAKLTMKAKEESYLEDQELGMEICYQLKERNFSSVLPALLVGNFLPMPSEGKGSHFSFILIRKPKLKIWFQVLLTQLKRFS